LGRHAAATTALCSALVLLAAGCAGVSEHQGPTTLAQARELAASRGVPVLLDFYTDW